MTWNCPVLVWPDAFPALDLKEVFAQLPWERRGAPRMECFMSERDDTYTYGRGAGERTYVPNPYPAFLKLLQQRIEENYLGVRFGMCFANYYASEREHLGWHSDHSPMINHDVGIAVVSLGAEREIWFRANGSRDADAIDKARMPHGSLIYMEPGMQFNFQHRIPKHPEPCGPRLSLTFRALHRSTP